jgi:hypothetical protein
MTIGGSPKVLIRVNSPKDYSSEYLLREALCEYRVRVRHTFTGGKNGAAKYDRHNFEIVKTTYATDTDPEFYEKFYFVWEEDPRRSSNVLAQSVCDLAIADTNELLDELTELVSG